MWDGVYEVVKKVHLGAIKRDLQPGQLILVEEEKAIIEFEEMPDPGIYKMVRDGFLKKVKKTPEEVRKYWKKTVQNRGPDPKKVPFATWRGR
jgi:hypothetical protein